MSWTSDNLKKGVRWSDSIQNERVDAGRISMMIKWRKVFNTGWSDLQRRMIRRNIIWSCKVHVWRQKFMGENPSLPDDPTGIEWMHQCSNTSKRWRGRKGLWLCGKKVVSDDPITTKYSVGSSGTILYFLALGAMALWSWWAVNTSFTRPFGVIGV